MNFEEFLCRVIEGLQKELGNEYSIRKHTINGINQTVKNSLIIEKAGTNISPCIHMDYYYECYISKEENIDEIISRIYKSYQENAFASSINISCFTSWNAIKPNIRCKLINTERNADYLQSVPHRKYLDLSIVYYVLIPEFGSTGSATIQIQNNHMTLWKVCEDILYNTAWENMQEPDNVTFNSMSSILEQLINKKPMDKQLSLSMYVLSNKEKWNGAIQICNLKALHQISNFLDDDFIILPSSIHECILIPFKRAMYEAEELAGIVREVNNSQLALDEILSYHVYRYSRNTRNVEIAA